MQNCNCSKISRRADLRLFFRRCCISATKFILDSVGAADVAGILPVVNTVTASVESSNKLADGEYYVNVTDYGNFDMTNTVNGSKFSKYAKLKVENGKYYATLT